MIGGGRVSVTLVGGHESAAGADLARLSAQLGEGAVATAPGRRLNDSLERALAGGGTAVVVPMTFGRDPGMVADTAKTLKWLVARNAGRIAISAAFGQPDHLIAWLRAAANRVGVGDDEATALLVVAPHSNPFDEAELHRLGYLVATHGALPEVHVAIADDAAQLTAAAARVRRLGPSRVVAVPAGFASSLPSADVEFAGPLMSDAAILGVIGTRVRDALAALAGGHDGIDAALGADHGHGYAHSHAFELAGAHTHTHTDGTTHNHHHEEPHVHFAAADGRSRTAAPNDQHH